MFLSLKNRLEERSHPIYIEHIRSPLLNALTEGNQLPVNLHFCAEVPLEKPWVKYRQAPDPKWKGPAWLITWSHGYAAVEAPHNRQAIWIPAHCIRPYHGMAPGSAQSIPNFNLHLKM
ncbi:hypothetical protein E2320_011232, partial [Naja naja]